MTEPTTKERTNFELRALVGRILADREAERQRAEQTQAQRYSLGSLLGVLMIAAGVYVFVKAAHDNAEWVAIPLIVLGAGLFDRRAVTSLLRARFQGDVGSGPPDPGIRPGP